MKKKNTSQINTNSYFLDRQDFFQDKYKKKFFKDFTFGIYI